VCAVVDGAGRAFTINQGTTTMTAGANPSAVVFGDSVTYSATVAAVEPLYGAPTGTVAFKTGSTTLCSATLAGGSGSCASSGAPAGVDNVVATYSGDTHYLDTDANAASFVVSVARPGPADQTITFPAPAPVTYGDPDSELGATASSDLAVSYSSTTTDVCTIAADKLHVVAAGSCTVQANQVGDADFNAATEVGQTFTIAKKPVRVDAQPDSKTYGDPDPGVSGNYLPRASDFVSPDDTVVDGTATCTLATHSEDAGTTTGAISCDPSGLTADNYAFVAGSAADFTITKAALSIDAGDQSKVYGTADPNLTYTLTGFGFGQGATSAGVTGDVACARDSGGSVGAYTITCAQGSLAIDAGHPQNYTFQTGKAGTFTITQAPQTVTFSSATPASAVVGSAYTPAATASSGFTPVTFGTSGGNCSYSGGTVTMLHAGTCTVTADQAGATNYNAAPQKTQSFTVGKGLQTIVFTSTAPPQAAIGALYTPTATASSGQAVTFGASGNCSYGGGTVTMLHAGTCTVTADQAGTADYNLASQKTQSITVDMTAQTIAFTSTPPSPALFGAAYVPRATGGGSGNPVVFSVDPTSRAGACSMLAGTIALTGPGSCVVDANQAGSPDYSAAAQKQQSFAVGFTRTLSGKISGSLTVYSGQSVYLSSGTAIGGSVTVLDGGTLSAQAAKIGGSLAASGAITLRVCGTSAGGGVAITKTAGVVVAGDDDGPTACAGNVFSASVSITGNYGGVDFTGNSVKGSLTITGNTGTLPAPDTRTVDATANKVSGAVKIQP
jgi:hypothetical protein